MSMGLVILVIGLAALAIGCQGVGTERSGAVTMRGNPLTLVGQDVQPGQKAPRFTAVGNDLSTFEFQPGGGVWILASVPSLDTAVCSTETRRFNQEAAGLPGVKILTVSMDLPFAQKRWCGAEGITAVTTVSDFRDREFGEAYGVKIKENGLLARAVFVVDKAGNVVYRQVVPELTQEPDYAAAIAAAKKAAGA